MPAPDYATEIASLREAMASGELTVEENGARVTYKSFAQLRAQLTYFEGLAAAATPSVAGKPGASSFAVFSRD